MAIQRRIRCTVCENLVDIMVGSGQVPPDICPHCMSSKAHNEKTAFLDHRKTLPIGERIAKLEEELYDLRKRLNDPPKYPMKF